jgi:electron transfer flavoprotein alpha subunit
MANKILVYIDHFLGSATPASWEALGVGVDIANAVGGEIAAIVLGEGIDSITQQAIEYGASEVLKMDEPSLKDFLPERFADLLTKMASEAEALIFPTSGRTRELAAMVAVDLETGVMPDLIAFEVKDNVIYGTRPIYAGKLLTKVACLESRPQILTLRGRAFPSPEKEAGRSGTITDFPNGIAESPTKVTGYKEAEAGVSLTDAAVIVSGGRGVANNPSLTPPPEITDEKEQEIWRAQQGFKLVTDLASALNAAVGASRAAVDAGYVPYSFQVGQTGKVVSPDLYIACGISGAIQHLAGMRTAKTIVAINKDGEAPIFKLARFGVVGDVFEILPPLTTELKDRLGKE